MASRKITEDTEDTARAQAILEGATGKKIEKQEKAGVLAERWVELKTQFEEALLVAQALVDEANATALKLYNQHGMRVPTLSMPNGSPTATYAPTEETPITATVGGAPISVDEIRAISAMPATESEGDFATAISKQFSGALRQIGR